MESAVVLTPKIVNLKQDGHYTGQAGSLDDLFVEDDVLIIWSPFDAEDVTRSSAGDKRTHNRIKDTSRNASGNPCCKIFPSSLTFFPPRFFSFLPTLVV